MVFLFVIRKSPFCYVQLSINPHKVVAPLFNRDGWHIYVWLEMLSLSGTPNFTPFGEFMILLICYIYIIYY